MYIVPFTEDARDQDFQLSDYLATLASRKRSLHMRSWEHGGILDQEGTPTCAACAAWAALAAEPCPMNQETLPSFTEIYSEARRLGGVSENDGLQLRHVLQYLKSKQLIISYYWASGADLLDEIAAALLYVGPVIISMRWPALAEIAPGGRITDTGSIIGDHAMLITGVDMQTKEFFGVNSRGTGWGDRGCFTLPFSAARTLVNMGLATRKI